MSKWFDFIVIGGGSGGIASAKRAAKHGAQVLLIEERYLGGTCVNLGCIPKKVMWIASQIAESINLAPNYGFSVEQKKFQWSTLKQLRNHYIQRLRKIYSNNLKQSNVTVIKGFCKFTSSTCVQVVGGEYYESNHILIATGTLPTVPDLPGAELGITSDGFFELTKQPMSLLIVGAGYIATEIAGLMNRLGSRVSMLLRNNTLLRNFDYTICETLMDQMSHSGIHIMKNIRLKQIFKNKDNSISLEKENGNVLEGYDQVIWAIGRHANVSDINLEKSKLVTNSNGFIEIDEYQNTKVEGIYAVGDVTQCSSLTPVAIAAGRRLSDRLFNNQSHAKINYNNIPTVVFSHPPVGTVGLTEEEAKQKFGEDSIKVYQNQFINMRYAVSERKIATLVKLITKKPNEKILGCHIIGESADEMLQGFAVAITMGATKKNFEDTIAIHPTASEEIITLG